MNYCTLALRYGDLVEGSYDMLSSLAKVKWLDSGHLTSTVMWYATSSVQRYLTTQVMQRIGHFVMNYAAIFVPNPDIANCAKLKVMQFLHV